MRAPLPFLFLLFYALSSSAQSDGLPDNTFGINGIVVTTITPAQRNTIHKLLEQPDGKIIAIGTTNEYSTDGNIVLARYNVNGNIDNSFGTNGIVIYNAGGWSEGTTGVLLANGKIVVAGFKNQGIAGSRAIVLRFNANGTIDNTYDGDGVLEIGASTGTLNAFYDIEKDISGSYYLSGSLDNGSGNADIAVVRLTAALAVDNSFGAGGIMQFPTDAGFDNYGYAISIQGDGKIVGSGMTQQGGSQRAFLFRLQVNGTLDMSFAGTGWFHDANSTSYWDIGIQSTGRIIATGFRYSGEAINTIRAYNQDGTIYPAIAADDRNRIGFSISIQDDDRFVVAGTDGNSLIFSVRRYNALGVPEDLDLTSGSPNDAQVDISPIQEYSVTSLILSSGKYLLAGLAGVLGSPNTFQFAMVRFLGLTGTIGLPVGLTGFTAVQQDQQVKLSWTTGFEQNNRGFDIQRSSNGRDFTKIGWIDGAGNSNSENKYAFTDASPANGRNYYRLKQLDSDGKYTFSEVRSVVFAGKYGLTISPNPATNKLTIQFINNNPKKITITDMHGRICWQQQNVLNTSLVIPVDQLSKGTYVLQVADNTGKEQVQKFIKE